MDGITIDRHDPRTAGEDVIRALHALEVSFEAEVHPDDAPPPLGMFAANLRWVPSYRDKVVLTALRDGETVGVAYIDLDRTGDNDHLAEINVYVAPEHRRQGVSRPLLDAAVDIAASDGRTLVMGFTADRVPAGKAYAESLGATVGLVSRESELDLGAVDRGLVNRWVAEGPERADGYELLLFEDGLPEDLRPAFSRLYDASNDAPRDDLQMEDEHRSPEQLAEGDRRAREAGWERTLVVVRLGGSDDLAGWSELARHPQQPDRIYQWWTAVDPKHRGHALGKWLKAANIARALERWPEANKIITDNAYTNDAMLGINNQLGFQETLAWSAWQVNLDQLRADR